MSGKLSQVRAISRPRLCVGVTVGDVVAKERLDIIRAADKRQRAFATCRPFPGRGQTFHGRACKSAGNDIIAALPRIAKIAAAALRGRPMGLSAGAGRRLARADGHDERSPNMTATAAPDSAVADVPPYGSSLSFSSSEGNGQGKPLPLLGGCGDLSRSAGADDELGVHPRFGRGGGIGVGATPMCPNVTATKQHKSSPGASVCMAFSASWRLHPHRHCNHSAISRAAKLCRCGCSRQLANRCSPSRSSIIVRKGSVEGNSDSGSLTSRNIVRMLTIQLKNRGRSGFDVELQWWQQMAQAGRRSNDERDRTGMDPDELVVRAIQPELGCRRQACAQWSFAAHASAGWQHAALDQCRGR